MRFMPIRAVLTGSLLAISGPANAVDGVLEINQTCAVNTGCFAGDTAGFPVTISASGSYRLTGNLDLVGTAVPVIQITADRVTLDLNGFMVSSDNSDPMIDLPALTGPGTELVYAASWFMGNPFPGTMISGAGGRYPSALCGRIVL